MISYFLKQLWHHNTSPHRLSLQGFSIMWVIFYNWTRITKFFIIVFTFIGFPSSQSPMYCKHTREIRLFFSNSIHCVFWSNPCMCSLLSQYLWNKFLPTIDNCVTSLKIPQNHLPIVSTKLCSEWCMVCLLTDEWHRVNHHHNHIQTLLFH